MKPKTISAPSKINLFLKVTGKRSDGYHTINTLFYPLFEICDEITITSSSELSVTCDNKDVPCDHRNLCWKAAESYAEGANLVPKWNIDIKKNIPIAAGMGGGSSDAAALLLLLQEEYSALSDEELHNIAVTIGADVPFFLNPKLSIAKGIGDEIRELHSDIKLPLLLIAPNFPIYAKWAYENLAASSINDKMVDEIIEAVNSKDLIKLSKCIHNDLAPGIIQKYPILDIFRQELYDHKALKVEISGSGPTIFSLFETDEFLEMAYTKLVNKYDKAVKIIPLFNKK